MNEEKQRIAIAEACGWKWTDRQNETRSYDCRYKEWSRVLNGFEEFTEKLPNYLNDLNAIHEAEKVLTPKQWNKYVVNLARVISGAVAGDRAEVPTNVLLSATAAQRALALIETLGKWEE